MAEFFEKFEAVWQMIWEYLYKAFAYFSEEEEA